MDEVDYHGPCAHCGRELWLIPAADLLAGAMAKVHGFELPDRIGWLAVADASGWSACPICGWAINDTPVSLN
jgi:hypothetical protein